MDKFKYIQNKNIKGFTLVEILVVIAIVGFLSLLAVGSYLEYRKISLINLAADNFVSQINQVRTKAVYGVFDKETTVFSEPECFGIGFRQDEGVWEISKFTSKYSGQKEWDDSRAEWIEKGCYCDKEAYLNGVPVQIGASKPLCDNFGSFDKDENVNVFKSFYESSDFVQNDDDFMVLFTPPKGQVVIFAKEGALVKEAAELITILRYGVNGSSRYQSGFSIDLNSGQASKLSYEDLDAISDNLLN